MPAPLDKVETAATNVVNLIACPSFGLCGRVFRYWEMSFGIVATGAMGVALTISIFEHQFLFFPYSVGLMGSTVSIYLGYKVHCSQSLIEIKRQLEAEIIRLKKELTTLKLTIDSLQASLGELKIQLSRSEDANGISEALNGVLNDQINDLEAINTMLIAQASLHASQQKEVLDAIGAIQTTAHKNSSDQFDELAKKLKTFDDHNDKLSSLLSEQGDKQKLLNDLLSSNNVDTVLGRLDTFQSSAAEIQKQNERLLELTEDCAQKSQILLQLKAQIPMITQEINNLHDEISLLSGTRGMLGTEVEGISKAKDKLWETVNIFWQIVTQGGRTSKTGMAPSSEREAIITIRA